MSQREHLLEAGRLGLRFFPAGDRQAHQLLLGDGQGGWTVLASSLEGTPQQAWPPSPPLQSIDVDLRAAAGPLALLVGMAGKSHWSASVAVDRANESITFDVACRLGGGERGPLASSYQLCGCEFSLTEQAGELCAADGSRVLVEIVPGIGTACYTVIDGELRIASAQEVPLPTVRWGYRFRHALPR